MEELNLGIGKFIYVKQCDTCQLAAASIFCRVDSLFLCLACDSTVHSPHARHDRVWMCDVCEHEPAFVTCKADAAALCAICDRDIHSANPLARRHERVPAVPFYGTPDVFAKANIYGEDREGDIFPPSNTVVNEISNCSHTSWTFPNIATKVEPDMLEMKSVDFLFSDTDQFLEFETDRVVPVQTVNSYEKATAHVVNQMPNKYLEIDFAKSKFNPYSHTPISQSISSTSMDVGVVPDGSAMSDNSYPYIQTSGSTAAVPFQGSDREARVMRYREKRKNRKFEKTIRYASRKAYAESRPRIKGRFAKRSESESVAVNKLFITNSSTFLAEAAGYGVVPSF